MFHANFHTKMIIFNICNQLKHIPSKALVAQWVHPFRGQYIVASALNHSTEKRKIRLRMPACEFIAVVIVNVAHKEIMKRV